jgi:histidine phosphotransferase ChpT
MTPRDVNALLGSRICHDLISPLGAIGNGVELLSLSGVRAESELSLIARSVESANTKIRFFRIAFGAASADQLVSASEATNILTEMSTDNRLSYVWKPKQDMPRQEVKLAFLLLQCLEAAMPWGGRIVIDLIDDAWTILGTCERVKLDEALWEMLRNPDQDAEVTASLVQFALVQAAAEQAGRRIRTDLSPNEIRIAF